MINYDSITDSSGSKTAMDDASSSSPSSSRTKARARPRVEVVTEIESNSMTNDGEQREGAADRSVTSQLTIRHVTDVDSGNYTCAPSNAEPASTMVYVSEGNFIFFNFFFEVIDVFILFYRQNQRYFKLLCMNRQC